MNIGFTKGIFVPPEDEGESPGRTRTSHPGGQGRITREDKSESPGRIILVITKGGFGPLKK